MGRELIRKRNTEEDSEDIKREEIPTINHGPGLSLEELRKLQEEGYNRTHGRVYYD